MTATEPASSMRSSGVRACDDASVDTRLRLLRADRAILLRLSELLLSGDAADALAGVRGARPVVQPSDRRSVVGVAGRRPHVEQLVHRELAVKDVPADQAELLLHVVRT